MKTERNKSFVVPYMPTLHTYLQERDISFTKMNPFECKIFCKDAKELFTIANGYGIWCAKNLIRR